MSSDLGQIVFDALAKHFRMARREKLPLALKLYPDGYLITYKQLAEATQVPLDPRHVGGPLFHISAYCDRLNLERVHSLVVRKAEGYPGEGYFRAIGTEVDLEDDGERFRAWERWARQCIESGSFPEDLPRDV